MYNSFVFLVGRLIGKIQVLEIKRLKKVFFKQLYTFLNLFDIVGEIRKKLGKIAPRRLIVRILFCLDRRIGIFRGMRKTHILRLLCNIGVHTNIISIYIRVCFYVYIRI